jgi:effector-binding domain-containing protein
LEARLQQIEQEDQVTTYDIVIKKIAPMQVASVRDIIPSYPEQGHLWEELYHNLEPQAATYSEPCLTVYHSDDPEIDAEVCQPLTSPVKAHGRVQVHDLPAVEMMAVATHHGPFVTIGQGYDAILQWIRTSGYRINGPCREIYLQPPAQMGSQSDPETITEIQFPVVKAE